MNPDYDKYAFPKIDITITTCKRIHLFRHTIKSFYDYCLDTDLINNVYIGDDGSSEEDIEEMSQWGQVIKNPRKGHSDNLNNLFKRPTTKYIYHLEDDWLFIRKGHFIRDSFIIMSHFENIKSVLSKHVFGVNENIKGIDFFHHKKNLPDGDRWSYSLNPSLQDIEAVRRVGKFGRLKSMNESFEHSFGVHFYKWGYEIATLNKNYCLHIGHEQSAYNINNTTKSNKRT